MTGCPMSVFFARTGTTVKVLGMFLRWRMPTHILTDCLSVCLSVCLPVCLSVNLSVTSVNLSVCLSVGLFVCLSLA